MAANKIRETLADALVPILDVAERNTATRRRYPDSWWDKAIASIDEDRLYKPSLYESPIEDALAYQLVKHMSPAAKLVPQHTVHTPWGRFRADFLITSGARRVCIECDGRDFHDARRDEWRDVLILGSGHADAVYRFSGGAIVHSLDDCLFVLSVLEPELFDDRGRANLEALSSDGAREREWLEAARCAYDEGRFLEWDLWVEVDEDDPRGYEDPDRERFYRPSGTCSQRTAASFEAPIRPFGCSYFDFARSVGALPLDEVLERYKHASSR